MLHTGDTAPRVAHGIPGEDDTIVAIATPPGRGAVAVVRLSGPRAHDIAQCHITPWPRVARQASLCTVHDASGAEIDSALVTIFTAPHSFTGEDTVEISSHGGDLVPNLIVASLLASGARDASPGEFTRRAVLHGKLDLVQAEAVGDLIDARSRGMHAAALQQLDGGLSRRVAMLREMLISLEVLIAYDIDFPDEDDGPVPMGRIEQATCDLLSTLDALLATAPTGELLRAGAVVVIAGAPNAGKSSLFNALIGRARAIVTEIPGTTRDALEAVVDGGAWPLRLVDTAGLRESDDAIERLGIEVSERYLAGAHVVLACGEDDASVSSAVQRVLAVSQAPIVAVRTKGDVGPSALAGGPTPGAIHTVVVSAIRGDGLGELLAAIVETIGQTHGPPPAEVPLLTRERHRRAIERAREEVAAFQRGWRDDALPAPVAAVHLHAAAGALEEMIGTVDVEDVFDRLFGSFCVGK